MRDADKLFDIFCYDDKQRKQYEIKYGLRMMLDDHDFFEDQKAECKGKCLDVVLPLSSADVRFTRQSRPSTATENVSTEHSSYCSSD